MQARFVLLAAVAAAAVAQPLSIQYCNASVSSEAFTLTAQNTVTNAGGCVGILNGLATVVPCVAGDAKQQWKFNSDGTVANFAEPTACWNVNGAASSANSSIIIYACGSVSIAANGASLSLCVCWVEIGGEAWG